MEFQDEVALFEHLSAAHISSVESDRITHAAAAQAILQLPVSTIRHYFNLKRPLNAENTKVLRQLQRRAADMVNSHGYLDQQREKLQSIVASAQQELSLRPWTAADVGSYFQFLDDPTLWSMVPEDKPEPFTEGTAADLIETANTLKERHIVYAIERNGILVGQARLQFDSSPEDDCAEISYWLGKAHRGSGLGTNLIPFITDHFFKTNSQIHHIFAKVLAGNIPSQRVVEKAGYQYESLEHSKVEHSDSEMLIKRYFVLSSMYPAGH